MSSIPFFCSLIFFFLLTIIPSSNAINITKMLGQYSDFSSFNDGLTKTGVAGAINSRQTLTVLVVDNGALSGVSGDNTLKDVLSLHVILDYYDVQKLQQLPNKTGILTTLFQTSGQANGKQGFLNVTVTGNGVEFGSAVPSSSLNSNLIKSVTSEPYNISILQVSSPIVPPNVGGGGGSGSNSSTNSTGSPPPKSSPGTPASSPGGSAPPKSGPTPPTSSPKSSPTAPAPSNSSGSAPLPHGASSPSDAAAPSGSAADSPSKATAPAADTPAATAPAASTPSDAPAADAPAADAPAGKSGVARIRPYGYLVTGLGAVVWLLGLVVG